jgi:hypothetical protein
VLDDDLDLTVVPESEDMNDLEEFDVVLYIEDLLCGVVTV